MTISTTTTRVTYTGDGVTVAFAVPFVFFGADELIVIEKVTATGAEMTKTLTTHYTVAGGNGGTGTVTALVSPPNTVKWIIKRATKRTQLTDYTPNDPFPADTHERALDRIVASSQENADELDRAAKLSAASSVVLQPLPDPVVGKFLRGNAGNDGYELADITSGGVLGLPVSIANGGTNAVTASAALSNLGGLAKAGDVLTGLLQLKQGADIASGSIVNLAAATGNVIDITGNNTINSLGNPQDGTVVHLAFTGTPTVSHNAGVAQNIFLLSAETETLAAGTIKSFIKRDGAWYEFGGGAAGRIAEDLYHWEHFI
jgi:hypothetical protein